MTYINQVLQSVKDSTRIRIIEIEELYAYIVNITNDDENKGYTHKIVINGLIRNNRT